MTKEKVTKKELTKEKSTNKKSDKQKVDKQKELKFANTIVLKDFHAEWCQPCKMQDKIIEELMEKYGEKIIFESIDIDKEQEQSERFKIMAVPTLIIQKNGVVVNRFVGVTSKKILENELNNLLRNIY